MNRTQLLASLVALSCPATAQLTYNAQYAGPYLSVHARDLSGDGVPETVHADLSSTIKIRNNNGVGQFPTVFTAGVVNAGFVEARVFDADFNAGDDIAAVDRAGNRIVPLLCMVWPSYFALVTQPALNVPASPVAVIDFDLEGDGDRDLAVISVGPPAFLTIIENVNPGTGPGLFWNQLPPIALPFTPITITAGDVGGSLLDDLVVVSQTDSAMYVFANLGGGVAAPVRFATDLRPYEATIADFDHDGDNDVAVTSTAKSALDVFLSTGIGPITTGTFAPFVPYVCTGATGLVGVDHADLDCDGDIDVVCAAAGSSAAAVFSNAGNGTFTGAPAPLPATARDVSLAQLDAGNNPDAALCSPTIAPSGSMIMLNHLRCGECLHTLRVGIDDNFAPAQPVGVEEALAGQVLQTQMIGQRHCDGSAVTVNTDFGHTFANLPPGIVAARLQIRLNAQGFDRPDNDALLLQAHPSGGFHWSLDLPTLTNQQWPPNQSTTALVNLDLANLPVTGQSLLAAMNSSGRLDVCVSDDTRVDTVRLELVRQCPSCRCSFTATATSFLAGTNAQIQVSGALAPSILLIGIGSNLGNGPPVVALGQTLATHCILAQVSYVGLTGTNTGTATLSLPIPAGPLPIGALRHVQVLSLRATPLTAWLSNTLTLPMYD